VGSASSFLAATLIVYAGVAIIACWGLDLQYGRTGVLNFSFILFQAIGGYTAAILTLGPSEDQVLAEFQHYVGGARLPYPLSVVVAGAVGGLLSIPVGIVILRRLRTDYQAIAMLAVSIVATIVAFGAEGLVGGSRGISGVPQPLRSVVEDNSTYAWFYAAVTCGYVVVIWLLLRRLRRTPAERLMRAIRENETTAASLGKNVLAVKFKVFVLGNVLAAISGALLVQFVGAIDPRGWLFTMTLVYFGAVIVGGAGNHLGVMIGAVLVPVGLSQAIGYLPLSGDPGMASALERVLYGVLIIGFLWWRPRGLIPERRRTFRWTEAIVRAEPGKRYAA
jgi:branched-chain amino acid transport system permease protein